MIKTKVYDGIVLCFDNEKDYIVNELKYLIFQHLISLDLTMPRRDLIKEVKRELDKERVIYDKELIDVLIEVCIGDIENNYVL